MTTIATDGKSMAGDGLATNGCSTITDRQMIKVWKLPNGKIVGCAGERSDCLVFRDWIAGITGQPVITRSFEGLVLDTEGSVSYYCDPHLVPDKAELPAAVGTGTAHAVAAMDAGATPLQAVNIACRRDVFSGGDCAVVFLGE